MPGARDVPTPYGSMRVNEWGPENGKRVVLVHGDATPSPLWSRIAWGLAKAGARVLTFDLWGRGYTDSPWPLPHEPSLFKQQIFYAITSSPVPWTSGGDGFSIVGYSLGGSIAVGFAADFPHLVNSVVALAPGGLLRGLPDDYMSIISSETELAADDPRMRPLVASILGVDAKVEPEFAKQAAGKQVIDKEAVIDSVNWKDWVPPSGRGKGGDQATLVTGVPDPSRDETDGTDFVTDLLQFQFDYHQGHVGSFYSTARYGPGANLIHDSWARVGEIISGKWPSPGSTGTITSTTGAKAKSHLPLLANSKLLVILGESDDIVPAKDTEEDVGKLIAKDKVEFMTMKGGHSFLWENSEKIVEKLVDWWQLR